jgi:hypothetical protein
MRQLLRLHPDSRCFAAAHIEVAVARPRADSLVLSYIVTGKISDVRMPPVMAAARNDELWRYTCFEAFVRASSGTEYYEFNFAPSTQWAAYRFDSYRMGKHVATEISAPRIDVRSNEECYTLRTSLELDELLPPARFPAGEGGTGGGDAAWRLGLSAVLEEASGRTSYWALAHSTGRPDFHHADCFACELPMAQRS